MAAYIPQPEELAKLQPIVDLYGAILSEIKLRVEAIEHVASGKSGLHGEFSREFCFLQLRMLCELIALACLVAHKDISNIQELRTQWSAGTMIKKMEGLHPDFFPQPLKAMVTGDTAKFDVVDDANAMTKTELLRLNGVAGDELHRGALADLLSPPNPVYHFDDVMGWVQKIVHLLAFHGTVTLNQKYAVFGILWDKTNEGRHAAWISVKSPPVASQTPPVHPTNKD
jgi:hypothetical protein